MRNNKLKIASRIRKIFLYKIRKGTWHLPAVSEITADQLLDRMNSNRSPLVIDVRGEEDFNGNGQYSYSNYGHIPNSKSIPIMELESNLEDLHSFKEKEIATICQGGGLSLVVAELLAEAGFTNVKSLTGGIVLWSENGYPIVKS